jgi:putative membrane protein
MRWLNIIVVALFALATILFAIQNFQIVTLSFMGFSARAPLALLVAIIYILGMATGGSLFALLRRSIARSRLTAMSKS